MGFKARSNTPRSEAIVMLDASHRRQEEELRACRQAAFALSEGQGRPEHVDIIVGALAFLRNQAMRHVSDEEESVFPRLGTRAALVRTLIQQHRDHEAMLGELEALSRDWSAPGAMPGTDAARDFADRFQAFYERYREHIELEDEELVPALAALDGPEQLAIASEMAARRPHRGKAS